MPLVGFLLGWALTAIAFFWDHRDSFETFPTTWSLRLTPYGFWVVFWLHVALGAWAFFYIVYVLVLAWLESRRRRAGPTGQSSGPPDGGR